MISVYYYFPSHLFTFYLFSFSVLLVNKTALFRAFEEEMRIRRDRDRQRE